MEVLQETFAENFAGNLREVLRGSRGEAFGRILRDTFEGDLRESFAGDFWERIL